MGWLIFFGVLAVWAAGYAGSCWWWPFARCRRCEGIGRFSRKDSKVWRNCRRCKGSGKRLRVGRWVWNYFAERRRATS